MSAHVNGHGNAFARAMAPVALALLGQPREKREAGQEWRYGGRGSLSIRVDSGTFTSHEPGGPKGGLLDLVQWKLGADKAGAIRWLKDHGHLQTEASSPKASPKRRQVASYPYTDADGGLLFEVVRFHPKDFRQRRPNGQGGWDWNLADVQRVPYRLPQVLAAIQAGELIAIAEGEKAADALAALGIPATCSSGGAGKWNLADYGQWFHGADVIVLPDNDKPGREHAAEVAADLRGKASKVRVIELPGLPLKGDAADWIEAGGTLAQLEKMTRAPPTDRPPPAPETALPLLWLDDISPVLEARDFVQGVLIEGGAAVIYGDSNAGKTFWTTDLALHVAAGKPWQGRRVDQGGVIYCAMEGGHGFRNRVAAWRQVNPSGQPLPFAAVPVSLNLLDPEADCQRLIDTIKAARGRMPCPVKLIVVDTLSRAMAGGNENSSEDMGALVASMDRIRAETGACVLFVHHSGKDAAKGARGHSLLRAAIDTEIEVRVDDDTGVRTAAVCKQRDLAKGAAFAFRLDVVTLGQNQHGEDVTTCLVEPATPVASSGRQPKLTPEDAGVLEDLKCFFGDPREDHQLTRPDPEMAPIVCATRNATRQWLIRRGRLAVAPGVAPNAPLSATERSRFNRYLNRLKDRGKVCMLGELIWLT